MRLRLSRLPIPTPTYKIVATRSSLRPTAKPVEVLGTYSPIPTLSPPPSYSPNGELRGPEWGPGMMDKRTGKEVVGQKVVEWNEERVKYWLKEGAKPTKTVERILVKAGIITPIVLPKVSEGARVMSRDRRIREAVRAMPTTSTPTS